MGARVITEIPGPASKRLLDEQAVTESSARAYPRLTPIAVGGADGAYLSDVDGNVFLDFLTGAGVLVLGHNHPELVRAAQAQLEVSTHGLDFPTEAKRDFTGELLRMLPEGMHGTTKIHFCGPTGADGVEAAIKLCKTFTGRSGVVSFHGGFHGSTQSTVALTGLRASKDLPGNPQVASFFPYSYCHKCPLGLSPESCSVNCIQYLENMLNDPNGGTPRPAAAILEMVQGEGGVIPAHPEFVRRLRETTTALDIPLIVDEVQTGCGRTGTWFAFEQYGIEPDVVVSSKGLGGGHPVSVILFHERLDGWKPAAHTGTFRGNQLAFAAGAAQIRVMERDDVLGSVRKVGAHLEEGLRRLQERHSFVGDVRGLGLMLGVEFGPLGPWPAGEVVDRIRQAALRRGLIFEPAGRGGCVARLLPPLNLTIEEADEALEILTAAVSEVAESLRGHDDC
ncbi:aspartate aminotransferase family protein [Streptomyces sp. TRM68367]|uniref:aspartate aminotransferase family protein n=1 Tax=Streptomyces sp. TRM68367 TaxID=2758415 RepID=UPI00165AA5C1|nr:diaminobutyrate--2-oxoglutarate transaminase family protein [Streptomyces sp. TRM68367]MBC9726534.1 diaminobutyrate--2-oxoglutarate transaminase family protein [Streptomyces sp. TRM68367]